MPITIGLVILVIYLFIGRLTATMIPGLAVPLSLLATAGGMYAMGFSIDNISLLGLTLSVGLVVDDAIVMLENIVRKVEDGMNPFEAAIEGSREVAGTIISMSISLVAVFLPILLMGGVIGRVFNEFGIVVTLAILCSAVISLTVTPMLAARSAASGAKAWEQGRHVRPHHRRLWPVGRLVSRPSRHGHAGLCRDLRSVRLAVCHIAAQFLPDRGYQTRLDRYRGAAGHFLSGDERPAGGGLGHRPGQSLGFTCDLVARLRTGQPDSESRLAAGAVETFRPAARHPENDCRSAPCTL